MTREQKRNKARRLYTGSNLTRKQIAEDVGWTEKTLRNWIDKEDWDSLKDAKTITRRQLLQDAYSQLKAINRVIEEDHNGLPNKQLSDAKGVIRKEIEALTEMPIHKYIEMMQDVWGWVQEKHPDKVAETIELLDEFIQDQVKTKGI